ncbi:MAG: DUF4232 domain-containing protein [Actinobacteria bacterium]|nr:DUF4232 domain-containing protein [Actinomycetota bacterium]MBO0836465.1 DUF4232 domain-containing protein [Actinomycetota bacterium]
MIRRLAGAAAVAGATLATAATLVTGCSVTGTPIGHVVPWNGAVPSELRARQVRAAAPCRASQLRVVGSGFQFVAGEVGGTGAAALRNIGPGACQLTGYPTVRLVGAPLEPAQRQVDIPPQAPSFPEIDEPSTSLQALAPGSTAVLRVDWRNWCVPGAAASAKPQIPPAAVRVTLGRDLGSLDVNYNAVPQCDAPSQPSTISVRPFAPSPVASTQPWTTANVRATIVSPGGSGSRVTARRGGVAHFLVRLQNRSRARVRFDSCPLVAEALGPVGVTEVHQLNCRAAHSIPPGGSLYFEMLIHVPAKAPLGKNGLLWELDPTGAQYPEAVAGLVVSR